MPVIRSVRAFTVRGGGADYHDQEPGHWIDGQISTPMSKYPEYRQTRRSFGINVLGTLVVEVEASDGATGFGVTTGGHPAAFIVEKHLARFLETDETRYAEAEQCYRRALEIHPKFNEGYYYFGKFLAKIERRRAHAEIILKYVIKLAPNYSAPQSELLKLYQKDESKAHEIEPLPAVADWRTAARAESLLFQDAGSNRALTFNAVRGSVTATRGILIANVGLARITAAPRPASAMPPATLAGAGPRPAPAGIRWSTR